MNWKKALVVSALASAGGVFAALGCGGDECTRADDHFDDCFSTLTSSSSSSSGASGPTEACTGSRLCHSQCINTYTCNQITGNDEKYTKCITDCNSK